MKSLSKADVERAAAIKMNTTMCHVGIHNAKRILYRAWKLSQIEEKRQKGKSNAK